MTNPLRALSPRINERMRTVARSDTWWIAAILLVALLLRGAALEAAPVIIHLKNGDRLTGDLLVETTNTVTLRTPLFGQVQVPLTEISRRETPPEQARATNVVAVVPATNTVAAAPSPTPLAAPAPTVPTKKAAEPKPPLNPANPEAAPIASTPNYWKHDLRFGLNMRYATRDSQEVHAAAKSTYGKPPFRHIFDVNFKYGKTDGVTSANSVAGSQKTEYQLSPKTYLFSLVGGGFDEVRQIDAQIDFGPGFGMELLKLTNFVWKGEAGFNFQQQYRSDNTRQTSYSLRIAEIFAWRIWEKLTADLKIEFFPNLGEIGEYRFRLESNLRYPVTDRLSLNLDVIDLYDTKPARNVRNNDLQIRSMIGVTF
jgi:putative salt-induced outer membrane protein YdiY